MATRKLKKVNDDNGRASIHAVFDGPIFQGNGPLNYACPTCNAVLAENIEEEKIWDLVVNCRACNTLCEFPRLPLGATATGYVFFPIGRSMISKTLEVQNTLLIGEGAIKGGGTRFN